MSRGSFQHVLLFIVIRRVRGGYRRKKRKSISKNEQSFSPTPFLLLPHVRSACSVYVHVFAATLRKTIYNGRILYTHSHAHELLVPPRDDKLHESDGCRKYNFCATPPSNVCTTIRRCAIRCERIFVDTCTKNFVPVQFQTYTRYKLYWIRS